MIGEHHYWLARSLAISSIVTVPHLCRRALRRFKDFLLNAESSGLHSEPWPEDHLGG
jgi:hypothetical protein